MRNTTIFAITIFAIAIFAATAAHAADLNKDDATTIAKDCRGIGPAIAMRIIESREKDGPFADYAALQTRIRGIGAKKRADIEQQQTCNIGK